MKAEASQLRFDDVVTTGATYNVICIKLSSK